MGSFSTPLAITTVLLLVLFNLVPSKGQSLSATFYDSTCPDAVSTIRASIEQAVSNENRMAASLLRLHFHDCFAQGCDASVLLDATDTIQTEQTATPNQGLRGFNVISSAKTEVERICPGVVSCADILALAARDGSVAVGGPSWSVRLGRRDSNTTSVAQANQIPLASDALSSIMAIFRDKGFNERDVVALSGAHTIGFARCVTFRNRIYSNGSNIDPGFAETLRGNCPQTGGNNNLAALDLQTPDRFDNNYYTNLVERRGLLASDQALFNGGSGSTDSIVSEYSTSQQAFESDFASAMIKMSEITPLLGQNNGIIRRVCNAIN